MVRLGPLCYPAPAKILGDLRACSYLISAPRGIHTNLARIAQLGEQQTKGRVQSTLLAFQHSVFKRLLLFCPCQSGKRTTPTPGLMAPFMSRSHGPCNGRGRLRRTRPRRSHHPSYFPLLPPFLIVAEPWCAALLRKVLLHPVHPHRLWMTRTRWALLRIFSRIYRLSASRARSLTV